jgi:hypothetical protein
MLFHRNVRELSIFHGRTERNPFARLLVYDDDLQLGSTNIIQLEPWIFIIFVLIPYDNSDSRR